MSAKDKAIEELAKLGKRSLDTLDRFGAWTDDVFGTGLRQAGGALEDSMAGFRMRNRIRVLEKTKKAIEKAGLNGKARALDPRLAIPIFEAIGEESDETLQDVWAAYIRHSVDPKRPSADRIVIDIVRRLEPGDWDVIQALAAPPTSTVDHTYLGLDKKEAEAVMDRLSVLGLFHYDDPSSTIIVMGPMFTGSVKVEIADGTYYSTKLLRRFIEAIGEVERYDG